MVGAVLCALIAALFIAWLALDALRW